jgi:hypothetical protein
MLRLPKSMLALLPSCGNFLNGPHSECFGHDCAYQCIDDEKLIVFGEIKAMAHRSGCRKNGHSPSEVTNKGPFLLEQEFRPAPALAAESRLALINLAPQGGDPPAPQDGDER